jgi:hypothetical protein
MKRLIDINGDIVVEPPYYDEARTVIEKMIDGMSQEDIDKSDMVVILQGLFTDSNFYMRFLAGRKKEDV